MKIKQKIFQTTLSLSITATFSTCFLVFSILLLLVCIRKQKSFQRKIQNKILGIHTLDKKKKQLHNWVKTNAALSAAEFMALLAQNINFVVLTALQTTAFGTRCVLLWVGNESRDKSGGSGDGGDVFNEVTPRI